MATLQETKKLVDVGEIGSPSTGDILFDGGVKLNTVTNNLYNAFGDYRLAKAPGEGVDIMVLHPMGYYQKMDDQYYASNAIELGSLHDVSTSVSSKTLTLPQGKKGEGVCIINVDGSFNYNKPLIIRPKTGESIYGVIGDLRVGLPFAKIVLFCTEVGANPVWRYKIESLFGDDSMPVEQTVELNNDEVIIPICYQRDYNVIKFMMIGESTVAGTPTFKTCEVMLHIDRVNGQLFWSEYAVIKNSDSEVFDIQFDNSDGKVAIKAKSSSENMVRYTVKTIDTLKIGAAT